MKEGQYSVKLSIYHNDNQKLVPTGIVLNEKDVDFLKKNKTALSGKIRNEEQRNLWNMIFGQEFIDPLTGKHQDSMLFKAQRIIADTGERFSFEEFAQRLTKNAASVDVHTDMLEALAARVEDLALEEKHNRETIYRSARQSLIRFLTDERITSKKSPKLPIRMVNAEFLNRYERYMLKQGGTNKQGLVRKPVSMTTIAYYTKCFSDVLNRAIDNKVISLDDFPIGRRGYKLPTGKKAKKALLSSDIKKIIDYKSRSKSKTFGRDMWVFTYLCNGINFSDICRLKWSNLSGDQISFVRGKTKNTSKQKGEAIKISLLPEARRILEHWAIPKDGTTDYIFGFISEAMTEREKMYQVRKIMTKVNTSMAIIAKELEIESSLTTYTARHSFATTLLRSEVPMAFISQSLGHTNLSTTQAYLGSFEDAQTQKYLSALMPQASDD